jgi:hypothetical protein
LRSTRGLVPQVCKLGRVTRSVSHSSAVSELRETAAAEAPEFTNRLENYSEKSSSEHSQKHSNLMLVPFARAQVANAVKHWTGRTKEIETPQTWKEAHFVFWLHPTPLCAVLLLCSLVTWRATAALSPAADVVILALGVTLWVCQEWCDSRISMLVVSSLISCAGLATWHAEISIRTCPPALVEARHQVDSPCCECHALLDASMIHRLCRILLSSDGTRACRLQPHKMPM